MRSRCRAALAAALALILLAISAAGGVAAGHRRQHSVLVDGDSLAVGTEPYLGHDLPGWRVTTSASISRHAPEGVSLLRNYGRGLPRVVVLSLGTNDDPRAVGSFRGTVLRALRIVGPHRCIVWPEIVRPPYAGYGYGHLNRVLHQEAHRHHNLRYVRWVRMVRLHRWWMYSDGVHPNASGYRTRARAIAAQVRRCR